MHLKPFKSRFSYKVQNSFRFDKKICLGYIGTEIDLSLQVQSLRSLETPWNVTFFHPYFPYFDQFLQVQPNTLKCLASGIILVLLITLLLIPDRQAGLILMLAIISIMLLIGQAMFLLDIYLDVISMMTLIMSVGFSVDFCVHLSHHFYSR